MAGRTSDFKVSAPGLRAMRHDLKRLKKDLDKDLKKEIRAQMKPVVMDARNRYDQHYTRRSGKSRRSIRASVTKGKVALLGNSRKTEKWMAGQEWGSAGKYPQFGERAGDGRFFWPAVQDGVKEMMKGIERAVGRATERARFR